MSEVTGDRSALVQRRDHVEQDLTELVDQMEVGEIDALTAARLETAYREEIVEIETAMAALPPDAGGGEVATRRSTRRAIAGTVIVVVVFTVAIAFIEGDTIPAQQGAAAGVDATAQAAPGTGSSLESMEQAATVDPDNLGLRLAIADVYFQREDYSTSLSHYLAVLEADPTPQEESVALGRVGWMAFITGQLEAAEGYLTRSVDVDPANIEGRLFLGYLLFFGLDDPTSAIPLLEEVLAWPDLGEELRAEVEQMLDSALENDS